MSESNGTITRNVLAVVGLIYVVAKGIQCFDKHIKQPLEKKLTEVFDDETEASTEWQAKQARVWNGKVDDTANQVAAKTRTAAKEAGASDEVAERVMQAARATVVDVGRVPVPDVAS